MQRFALVCLLTVLLGSVSTNVWAGDEILNYVSIGRGLDTCTVMATASDERYPRVIHWLAGYLTSYNRWQPDTYDITGDPHASDWETWMQQYCMRYPTLPIARAAEAFVHAFYASRLTQAPHEGLPPAPQPTPPHAGRRHGPGTPLHRYAACQHPSCSQRQPHRATSASVTRRHTARLQVFEQRSHMAHLEETER